jgi:hypothetical protein
MAEKSLVNCEVEMLGVGPDDELVALPDEVVVELELDELPQPTTTAATTSVGTTARNQRRTINTLLC